MDVGMDVGVGIADGAGEGVGDGVSSSSGVGEGGDGVLISVGSCTLMGVRVAVGSGVSVGGGTVGMGVCVGGGAVGGGMGVDVAGGLGVLVGVGVGVGEELQPLSSGNSTSPLMAHRQRKTLVMDTDLVHVIIV